MEDFDATIPPKQLCRKRGDFSIGDVIADRYQIISILERGALGTVYRCLDKMASLEVALKGLPPELSGNDREMDEIKRNFQLVHKLHHHNIANCNTIEFDQHSGSWFLVMEFIDGVDLRRYCRENHPGNDVIINIIKQIAGALDYAHSQQILHRDIKPENIIIDRNGVVKILNFGLTAQIRTSMTRVSMVQDSSGTASYMSPEQWRGKQQKAASDQYALGVVAYEMFAGFLPFESSDFNVLRSAVLNEEPDPLENVPPAIQSAVARVLSKNPAERFSSCTAFAEALTAMNVKITPASQVIPEVKPIPVKTASKIAGWKIVLAVILLLIFLGGGSICLYAFWDKPSEEKEQQTTEIQMLKKQGVEFSGDEKTLIKCPKDFAGEMIIPDGVTEIRNSAFNGCKNLTSVKIPKGVTYIGESTFSGCENLNFVSIPNGVTEIEDNAFHGCYNLTSIRIPDSVTHIGSSAFLYTRIDRVILPENCKFDTGAFPYNCKVTWR